MYRKEAALGRFWGGLAGPRGSAAPQKGASAEGRPSGHTEDLSLHSV